MSEYIERGSAFAILRDASKQSNTELDKAKIAFAMVFLSQQPAADVEPVVRGEWVEMRDPYGDLTGWIHEECGMETNFASEYCSKCGAKMTFVERSGSGETD